MAVTIIPNVTNWSVTPQNGQVGYFTLMNTWLSESTAVIASLQASITAQNTANSEINDLAIQVASNATDAQNARDEAVSAIAILSSGAIDDTSIAPNKAYSNQKTNELLDFKLDKDFSLLTDKSTPIDTDNFVISEVSGLLKKLSWTNIKASLDSLYVKLTGNQSIDGIKNFTSKILTPDISYKDTAITINSWSYSGKTITLTVASHTFVADDYIEVSGLTSTTYPANGIHLVTSVTTTTIVFTLATAPTGTAGVSSATVKGYATINGKILKSIGIGQAYQNVSSARAIGLTYTNTTGTPITVLAAASGSGGTISIDGVLRGYQNGSQVNIINFVVPNGSTYSINSPFAIYNNYWSELR